MEHAIRTDSDAHQKSLPKDVQDPHQLKQLGEFQASVLDEQDDDDEEIRQLKLEIQSLAAKVQQYRDEAPALISSRLQQSLQVLRPQFSFPDDQGNTSSEISGSGSQLLDDDPAIAQAAELKARIAALNADLPAVLARMKRCLEAVEAKQSIPRSTKPLPPAFL